DNVFENGQKIKGKKNLVVNGGFEVGPAFPNNSFGGIILDAELNPTQSPLNQWAILGTVKYITTNKNYEIPEGVAAIELVSGRSSGVQTTVTLNKGSKYDLKVYISGSDAACIGSFQVSVQAGSIIEKVIIERRSGIQLSSFLWTIEADSSVTPISIRSITTTKTKDQVFCGPVIDNVILVASYGLKLQISVLFVGIGFLAKQNQTSLLYFRRVMGIWQVGAAGLLLLLLQLQIASAFAANLKNPDFEKPPTNIPKNSTNQFIPLNSTINTLPGWSYQGTVQYINQTFKAVKEFDQNYDYILTFSLKPAQPNCTSPTSVTISVPNRSVVVSFDKKFGNSSSWQTHASYLGVHGNKELINLTIENQSTNTTKCGVVLDSFIFELIPNPITYDTDFWFEYENGKEISKFKKKLVLNGGFEVGPAFSNNSFGGVLMSAESNPAKSPLNQWAIFGTVKYRTTNKNYEVPEGVAAIELVSGKSSGVQTTVALKKGSEYNLEVFVSENNDACIGKFEVGVQAGSIVHDFVMGRNRRVTGRSFSWIIKAESSVTPISIRSSRTTKTKGQVFCGPVIDNVIIELLVSYGLKLQISMLFVGIGFLATLAQITG
ncbi:hypothetical protein MKW98_007407, partial [Papaver atlanticum]